MTGQNEQVLLLDFGGVCLVNPVELHRHLEAKLELPAGTFTWFGPVDPSTDELWRRMVAGDGVTERDYWAIRAAEVGAAVGRSFSTRDLMKLVYAPPTDDMIRPGCRRVAAAAAEAGWTVSVFSNDLGAFHDADWAASIPLLQQVDQIIDCSHGPALKPDPQAYRWALDLLCVPAESVVFVDDQPANVDGARACGIESIWFDVANAEACWALIGERVGV